MKEYDPRQTDMGEQEAGMEDGGLPAELTEDTEAAFVAETPKANHSMAIMLLTLVIIGGGGVYFMRMKAGPGKAAAAPLAEAVNAQKTITEFLTDGGRNLKTIRELLQSTEKVVERFKSDPGRSAALHELKANPFQFAKPKGTDEEEQARLLAENKAKERKQVAQAAGALRLQSIISGSVNTCMIDGKAYKEGDQVAEFTIESIQTGSVVVRRGSDVVKDLVYRLELRIQR